MEKLIVHGQRPLNGEIRVNGAKNAALPILAAALLTRDECVFENVPDIEDIRTMVLLLERLGCKIHFDRARHVVKVQAHDVTGCEVPRDLASKMRASFLVSGPLLARIGCVRAPHPGGCAIGRRPVNVDIKGFAMLGANVVQDDGTYSVEAPRLVGQRIYLDYPSHTGTENIMMAACLAEGTTIIKNASAEPEVWALAECLVAMGARIRGAGTSLIVIDGVRELHGISHRVLADRIEAGTLAIAAALTAGDVTLTDLNVAHMDPLTHKLLETGVLVDEGTNQYRVRGRRPLRAVEVQTLHYPGFPTDLQAEFTVLLTQAVGTSIVHERVFDNRLQYTEEIEKMGARIRVAGQTATVEGPTPLKGADVRALDLRCGAALVLAGLIADGQTVISDVHHVDRGYERLDERLRQLGASINRVAAQEAVA